MSKMRNESDLVFKHYLVESINFGFFNKNHYEDRDSVNMVCVISKMNKVSHDLLISAILSENYDILGHDDNIDKISIKFKRIDVINNVDETNNLLKNKIYDLLTKCEMTHASFELFHKHLENRLSEFKKKTYINFGG